MKGELKLRLRNSWKYVENDRWDWAVFLEDDGSGDLEKVDSVTYILHSSFPNPKRRKKNKQDKFKLETNGWGIFWIKAFVKTLEGKKIKLDHYLELSYEPENGTTD